MSIPENKKPFRLKWAGKHVKPAPPKRVKPPVEFVAPDLENMPRGMSFETMDAIIARRGRTLLRLKHDNRH